VKLEKMSGLPCGSDGCPTVYRTDRNTVVICSKPIDQETHATANLTEGEIAVEIPVETLVAAAKALAPP